jgi:hypothetical protein
MTPAATTDGPDATFSLLQEDPMNKLMIAFVVAVSLASFGCKKKGGGAAGEYLAKFEGWKNDICKCADGDAACANKVLDEQKKYGEEMAKKMDKDAKPDPKEAEEQAKKLEPITAEYTKCMTKAMTPKAATPPPDDKKADDKKPDDVKADVKADDKKPDDKKPDDKKPADKKDDKKAGGW